MSWKAKSFEDAKNSRTSRIWCFVSLLTRIRLGRREGPMEIDSDSGDDGDYETLGLLAVAVASFAKGKHNMIEDEDGCRYTWEMLMMERTPRLRRRRGRHRHARRRVFPRRDHIASAWAQMLRREALNDHHSAGGEFFRRRFRVPYVFFVQLVEVVEDRGWFKAGPCENRERANPFLSTCYTQHNSMIAPQRRRAAAATPTATTASRRPSFLPLLLLASALHPSSSFLFPITAVSGLPPSCKTWSASLRPQSASSSSDVGEPVQSSELGGAEDEVDDAADGRPTSPAGLTLEGVYKRLKLECVDIDEGAVQLESKDTDYGIEVVKVTLPREPSLGLQMEEVARGGDGRGLVLISGTAEGGNAEATGKIFPGDTLCWVGVEPARMTRVEALDWDQTIGALGDSAGERQDGFRLVDITLVIKRLVKRETIDVKFELPGGTRDHEIKAGSNLRGEMIRLDVPVYDPKTMRYDQPYATGNCAGEGICGTCFVEVLQGAELLSPADREELMVLSQGRLPVRWRLSCRTIVGTENKSGTLRVKAVPQAEWRSQRSSR
eukprot:jgi/Undpi1/10060/HiC_scaffold_28.g12514.m1